MKAPVWVLAFVLAAAVAPAALAHARISPSVSVKGGELYSLVVPTEKEGATTTKVALTLPDGFTIDSFVAAAGWKRSTSKNTVVWSGGKVPTDEDALFQFLGETETSKTFTFSVQQTYSDGEVVDWSGPESSDMPAPTIEVKDSLGGGGNSTLALVALVVGIVGVVLAAIALVSKSGRQLV